MGQMPGARNLLKISGFTGYSRNGSVHFGAGMFENGQFRGSGTCPELYTEPGLGGRISVGQARRSRKRGVPQVSYAPSETIVFPEVQGSSVMVGASLMLVVAFLARLWQFGINTLSWGITNPYVIFCSASSCR